ncbi:MAG: hypothetical protein K9N55_01990 [Phycisphaerae bacterium]|nr:hypothetical protein [Phycisphaerae bacterium]
MNDAVFARLSHADRPRRRGGPVGPCVGRTGFGSVSKLLPPNPIHPTGVGLGLLMAEGL